MRRSTSKRSELVSYGLIAAAVGLAVVVVVDRDRPTTKEQVARAGMLLRVFRPDDITRISIARRGEKGDEKVELVRDGDTWKMVAPRVARTDFLAVTSLINALQGARAERSLGVVTTPGERAQLGLDAPRAKVEIAMKGVSLTLSLGGPATGAAGEPDAALASYVEVAPYGDEKGGVYVVGPDVAAALDRGESAFREPSLLGGNQSSTFTRIAITGPSGALVTLDRGAHGTWRTAGPNGPVRANADAVDGLLKTFYDLKADPFVPDATPVDPGKGGTIEISLASGEKVVTKLGGACPADPKLVVAQLQGTPPSTGCVAPVLVERALKPADFYGDERAFGLLPGTESAKTSEIESVLIEASGAKVLEAERRGDGLHLRVPTEEQVDKEATDRYLARLAAVSGTIVPSPDLAALGLATPAGKATIKRRVDRLSLGPNAPEAGSEVWEQVVEISAAVPEDPADKSGPQVVHLRRLDDGVVLRVPLPRAQPLRAAAVHDLRNPNLLSVTSDAITRVVVKPNADAIGFDLSKQNGFWSLAAPKGLGADVAAVTTLADRLSHLTCLRWAAEKDDGSFGFSAPSAVIEVERAPKPGDAGAEPSAFVVELGSLTADGGVHARVRGRDPVCVLPLGARDVLLRAPVDGKNVGFDPTVTPKIELRAAGRSRTIAFDPTNKSWGWSGDAGASEELARKLADSVRALSAYGLVHLGPEKPDEGLATPKLVLEGFDGTSAKKKIAFGAVGKFEDATVYYARIDGVDATWAVLKADVDRILEQL